MHYLRYGANDGEEPGPLFSGRQYLESNPDVASAGQNPLLHYEMFGRKEGRPQTLATSMPGGRKLAPTSGVPEGRSDAFSILHISGESTPPSHFFHVPYYSKR